MATVTMWGKTFEVRATGVEVTASSPGNCELCHARYAAGTKLAAYVRSEDGKAVGFHHATCPRPAAAKTAPAAPTAQPTGPKRAKFASRCPGCGSLIAAGAPLFYDADFRRYVSDCCV